MNTNIPPVVVECIEQGIDALRFKARYRMTQWNTTVTLNSQNTNSDYAIELNKQMEECYNAAQVLESFLKGNKNASE